MQYTSQCLRFWQKQTPWKGILHKTCCFGSAAKHEQENQGFQTDRMLVLTPLVFCTFAVPKKCCALPGLVSLGKPSSSAYDVVLLLLL